MKKVMITIDESVLDRIDSFVKDNGYNRSTFFTMASNEFLNTREVLPRLTDELSNQFSQLMDAINEKIK